MSEQIFVDEEDKVVSHLRQVDDDDDVGDLEYDEPCKTRGEHDHPPECISSSLERDTVTQSGRHQHVVQLEQKVKKTGR